MRDKIVFFILGVVVATLVYFFHDMNNATAQEKTIVEDLLVTGTLWVKSGNAIVTNGLDTSNAVRLEVDDTGTRIGLINGLTEDGSNAKSTLFLTAETKNNKSSSRIILQGESGQDFWSLYSNKPIQ